MFKILLVDDEPIIKIGVRKLLEGTDYIIAWAHATTLQNP